MAARKAHVENAHFGPAPVADLQLDSELRFCKFELVPTKIPGMKADGEDAKLERATAASLFDALTRHEAKIRLLTNPNEPDHCELAELVEAATALADEEFAGVTSPEVVDRLADAQNKIVAKAQSVLKREWERVKKQN